MFVTYILYSHALGRYYVGYCQSPLEERLRRHLSSHKGFTGKASDWQVAYTECFASKAEAYAREREIKAKKSRKYIEWLISQARD